MSLDSRDRFSATVDAYERYRPGYPEALVDWLIATTALAPGTTVVDLGCGTGISSRLLAARGFEVIGVEPNDAMRERAEARGGARYVRGEAANTGLPDACAALVTAAQAFHWFDVPLTMREIARVLRPQGWAAAFWNKRAHGPFLDAYEALLLAASSEYRAIKSFDATVTHIRDFPGARAVHEQTFTNPRALDREAFFGLVQSSSYVVHGIADREAFDRELEALFATHVRADGTVDFATRTVAIAWQLAA